MNITEHKPYLPFATAMITLALPLAVALYTTAELLFRQQPNILSAASLQDATTWFVFGVFWLLNAVVSTGLTKVAHNKMMRRRFQYALFLAGIAACLAAVISVFFEAALGSAALGGLRSQALICYTASVFILARGFLPKTLTRAPVQPITFHRKKT